MEEEAGPAAASAATAIREKDAFVAAVRPMMASLLRTATAILGDEAEARDALQDALASAWRNRSSLRDPSRHDAWLARILLNQCRMALRQRTRHRRHQVIQLGDLGDVGPAERADFTLSIAARDAMNRGFERLNPDARTILVLRYLDDRPVSDIARLLSIPEGTVKSRLFAARHALAAALDETSA